MKNSILIILIITLCLSCGNDDAILTNERTLPPITQIGANTFGCYIDELLFIPRNGSGTFNSNDPAAIVWGDPSGNLEYQEYALYDYVSEKTSSIFIHIQGIHQNGDITYVIDKSNGLTNIDGLDHTYMHCRVWRDDVGNYQNYLSYENSGTITITNYNFYGRLVSGTFSGSVRNYQEPHDTIQITNGRFDFNWETLDETDFP
ncbi:hypothetical protein [Psychroserpens ponticola]|uniref:Uncharacterized protein n=1 Tax=Psychroserpens ponticola TaxID=2932268 RepID=A0ABY7RVU9_9FLAO|nr:hypothetical protein [Psychroserpens ponticola]WCO01113.1 hypothetical protein MUN68_013695 [Psychroserpens ponticola]